MKLNVWCGMAVGVFALAVGAMGATFTDSAANYGDPHPDWVDGSNGGTGFEPWSIVADNGGTGWAGCGIWDSSGAELSMGMAFGYVGKVGYVNIDRDFSQALNVGDSFAFDFGVNWDSDIGNKGFSLFANGVEVINVNHGGYPGEITLNGAVALAEYGTQTMRWTFTQEAADQIAVFATGRDGVETHSSTVTVANGYGYLSSVRFYSSGLAADAPDQRQSYFDNLTLEQEGTPPPPPLNLALGGTWNPQLPGDYEFTLTRTGNVGDDIDLASNNEATATVPESVSFEDGVDTLVFTVTVVSVTSGPATIIASNAASGAWTDYVITPVVPMLEIDGAWQLYAFGPQTYTLRRYGAVGTNIVLASSNTDVMTVPASVNFGAEQAETTFGATALGFGATTLTASNPASGMVATFNVTVSAAAIELTGPVQVWAGDTRTYTVTRFGPAGDTVYLSSSDTDVMTVPAQVDFPWGEDVATFNADALVAGSTVLSAWSDDVPGGDTLAVEVAEMPGVLAHDEAGNYTPATFVHGANEGFGFGAWNLWNVPATLGDSTAGGGGDLNSTNGYSFRFMGDGEGGWCNGERQFSALQPGDVLSFTFTYNWDGGGRGVDIFSAGGQFANLIDVSPGNTFRVNGTTISTEYSPGAVVEVEIAQLADGIQMSLTRSVGGVPNLSYTTNILHGEGATGVSMYCGGYNSSPEDNANYAIFMNDLMILGEERTSLEFTGGTWNPAALGDYAFELTRSGAVDEEIVLTSDNEAAVTVPASVAFEVDADTVSFNATVVSLAAGSATIVASNVASGAWAEYTVHPVAPQLAIDGPWLVEGLGALQYTLTRSASVGTHILLSSSNTNVLWVPVDLAYGEAFYETTFPATALSFGTTTLIATNTASGAWAEYHVTVQRPEHPPIEGLTFLAGSGNFTFAIPAGFVLGTVYGADCQLVDGDWDWQPLELDTDYTVDGGVVTILTESGGRMIIRIGVIAD